MHFTPTRTAGLARLSEFLPRSGADYARTRNYDDGAQENAPRQNVSQLSPWLHAGLLSESEVINTVLSKHSPSAAEKFVAEVFWRVYFKGYLEQRPTIWRSYTDGRDAALAALNNDDVATAAYSKAIDGRTGIAAFDHWARELVSTGYLHNHARMWFASIWIFTLKLDWHLGADFFLRHLVDGDAASNTLSWRWIGGLHTKGKTYLARAGNIARYTANHANGPLAAEGLASEAPALDESEEHGRSMPALPGVPDESAFEQPFALILHDEAASHVPLALPKAPSLVIGASRPEARAAGEIGELAQDFTHSAVKSGVAEAAEEFGCEARNWTGGTALADILAEAGIDRVALPYLPVGWTRDALQGELSHLVEQDRNIPILSDLDRATWPTAKAGFFGVKKQIAAILGESGITGNPDQLDLF